MRQGTNVRSYPDEDSLLVGNDPFEPVGVVKAVDNHESDAGVHCPSRFPRRSWRCRAGRSSRVDTGGQGERQLTATGDVDTAAFLTRQR
jgi:hypothetical protein